jgi:hypothetical protein
VIRRKLRAWFGIPSPSQQLREQIEGDVAAYMSGFDAAMVGLDVLPGQRALVEAEYRYLRIWAICNPSIGKRRNA